MAAEEWIDDADNHAKDAAEEWIDDDEMSAADLAAAKASPAWWR